MLPNLKNYEYFPIKNVVNSCKRFHLSDITHGKINRLPLKHPTLYRNWVSVLCLKGSEFVHDSLARRRKGYE